MIAITAQHALLAMAGCGCLSLAVALLAGAVIKRGGGDG